MNVAIYARFSSHSQTEQSIEGQLKVCYEYAKNNDYIVVGEYIDRAQTGKNDNRVEFQKMLSDSDKHTFEGVLVYQLDRFARNRYDSAINKSKLKKNGVRVISAKENIADDPSGILVEGVLESMAEYYSAEHIIPQSFRRKFTVVWKLTQKSVFQTAVIRGLDLRWIPIAVSMSITMKRQLSVKFMSAMRRAKQKRKSFWTYREEKSRPLSVKSSAVTA